MKLLFIKGDNALNVRMAKYFDFFGKRGDQCLFWGWDRDKSSPINEYVSRTTYLLSGGGFGGKKLLLYYPIWMIILFFKVLLTKNQHAIIVVVNFDAALPVYIASLFRRIPYIYEVHDEFAISYHLPSAIKKVIRILDHAIMRKSDFVIHVDSNRVNYSECRSIVLENSPADTIQQVERDYAEVENIFAVIGNISTGRGINSIRKFAYENPTIRILLVGKFYDPALKTSLLNLPNIEYQEYMPQDKLFSLLRTCSAIFSLYDPSLEVNRLAASNKVYDAMMLGIPVITNPEVINSRFIKEEEIGIIVDYEYNETWDVLVRPDFIDIARKLGRNGRKLYLNRYRFDKLIEQRLLPELLKHEADHTRP